MHCPIDWRIQPELSSLYAAYLLAAPSQKFHNQQVAQVVRPIAKKQPADQWLAVVSQSIQHPSGAASTADQAILAELHSAVLQSVPNLPAELTARRSPIKMQWEARGPGMIASIRQTLASAFQGEAAVPVYLVQPWSGGNVLVMPPVDGGQGGILFEAVLTDVIPGLPEVVRLTWAVARFRTLPSVADDAVVDAVLEAAESVGLVQSKDAIRELAHQWS